MFHLIIIVVIATGLIVVLECLYRLWLRCIEYLNERKPVEPCCNTCNSLRIYPAENILCSAKKTRAEELLSGDTYGYCTYARTVNRKISALHLRKRVCVLWDHWDASHSHKQHRGRPGKTTTIYTLAHSIRATGNIEQTNVVLHLYFYGMKK